MKVLWLALRQVCVRHAAAPAPEMCVFWATSQVHRLKKTLVILFYVYMLSSVVLAIPRPPRPVVSQENGRQVITFYNKPCIPVDPKLLHQRMGPAFDPERMAMDEESTKRTVLRPRSSELTYYGDEDNINDDEDDVEEDEELEDELESQDTYSVKDYSRSQGQWSGRFRRNSRLDESYPYKTRNLRNSNSKISKRSIRKSLKSILKRLERKQRKKRNPARNEESSFHPPWECKMKPVWKLLDPEYFPRYLQTGVCQNKKCVLNLYECIPKPYPVKILRRDPNRCNPVPTYGLNTTYEERWFFESKHVTVCCECGSRPKKRSRIPF